MKVFWAHASISQGCGCCYDDYDETVVANSEEEALGFLLELFDQTLTKHWTLEEVDLTKTGVWGYE